MASDTLRYAFANFSFNGETSMTPGPTANLPRSIPAAPRRASGLSLLLAIFLLPLACAPGDEGGPWTTQRDSAGVTVVLNTGSAPTDGGGWDVADRPSLSIGTIEGVEAYQLFGVSGAYRFDDGRIAVVNAGSREVRIFDPQGVHLANFGQRGAGPEEFEMPVLAGAVGDTLLIVDQAQHRLTLLHPDSGFLGVRRVSDEVGGYLNPAGAFANGQMVFGGAFDMRRVGELHNGLNQAHTFYRASALNGSLAADFGDKNGADFFIRDMEGEGRAAQPALIPFGRVPIATVSPRYFYFSDQSRYEIEVYEDSGALVRLIRLEQEPVAVTPEDGERYIQDMVEGSAGDNPEQASAIRAFLRDLPLPETFPPHGELRGDYADGLWVQDFQRPGAENRAWNVFDDTGVLVGRVTLPERFNPLQIEADYILGLGWDEMGVEYVRLYDLARGG